MQKKAAIALLLTIATPLPSLHANDFFSTPASSSTATTIPEIPYYLKQLGKTASEQKRMESVRIVHDAVVKADLSSKKNIKLLDPMVLKIKEAIANGMDQAYLAGESSWLQSAVDFYEREKGRPVIDIPESEWMPNQTTALNGSHISTYPDKILIHEGDKSRVIVESTNIHEAVISPDGKNVAFFRNGDDEATAQVWVANVKKPRRKKVAEIPNGYTLVFSLDGGTLFIQERPKSANEESTFYSVSTGGGSKKQLGTARVVETIVPKGKYAGAFIIYKVRKHHLGITQEDYPYAYDKSGREIGRLKNGPAR